MTISPSRRQFLSACAVASAGAALPCSLRAIEPIERKGPAKFKFSLAAYSYRKLLTGKKPELTLSDFIADCASFGLEGTELTSYYFPAKVTDQYVRQLKRECFLAGLDVSGTAIRNDFGYDDGPERTKWIEHTKAWVDHAERLGAPVIRVFAGHIKKGSSPEEAHKRIVAGLEECCEYAGQHGVHLALENHGGPTATAEGLLSLVEDVQSPWFGVNLDTGNFHSKTAYDDLAKAAPFAINVQVKVVIDGPSGREPADFKRIAGILKESGYRGYVVLEYEESGDPREECAKYLDKLRDAFA
ncbi:MAG: sugar phosphate isomerase/epimerase family protein [Pirellulaceae bacterium]|nr:sugar phosphate isomerase/epimerase family protein [Pirellulaceae bacterium]MDP7020511.1 sugar phosphate isomerase/epimerase family protein [Pirellulaceae bacterium]